MSKATHNLSPRVVNFVDSMKLRDILQKYVHIKTTEMSEFGLASSVLSSISPEDFLSLFKLLGIGGNDLASLTGQRVLQLFLEGARKNRFDLLLMKYSREGTDGI